jgi:hypothetical protein
VEEYWWKNNRETSRICVRLATSTRIQSAERPEVSRN